MANENVTLLILHHLIGSLICIISRACSCFYLQLKKKIQKDKYFGRVVCCTCKKMQRKMVGNI